MGEQNARSAICSEWYLVRFEVFTAVTMEKAVFWDVAPCRSGVNRRFGDQSAFNVSDGRFACGFSYFTPLPWRWRRYVPPRRRLTPLLHGATSQKTAFFIVTAVKTSNLTKWKLFKENLIFVQCHFVKNKLQILITWAFILSGSIQLDDFIASKFRCHIYFP
jgi:hypothetical protein